MSVFSVKGDFKQSEVILSSFMQLKYFARPCIYLSGKLAFVMVVLHTQYTLLCTLSPLNSVHRIFVCWRGWKIIIVLFHPCLFSSFSWISCFHAITYSNLVHSKNANQIIFSLISCVRQITYKLVNIAWIPPFFLLINHFYNFFSLPSLHSDIFLFKEMSDLYIAFVYVKSGFRFMRSPDGN